MAPVNVLMVAEKPSLADSIAYILSNGKMRNRRGVATQVHEYEGQFKGKPAKFKVTAVMGHVYSLDFPKEYNNWGAVEPVELFDAPTVKMESNPKQHVVRHLQVEGKNVDYLVLWLDCDREGENICFEVMKCVQVNMNKPPNGGSKRKHVFRAKFSAITATEIKNAMAKLSIPNENEARAVDVRQELDLKIGCAFTRFQTRYFQGKYGNLDSSLVSFGPCQTPTLALCVKRHDEILSFVPKKFWSLSMTVRMGDILVKMQSDRGRIFEKKSANGIRESLNNHKFAKIVKVAVDKKSIQRPQALNTVEMLKAASTGLGMSPQHTMQIAERLYMSGFISYPRTETTKYPPSFDLNGVLKTLAPHPQFGSYCEELLQNGFTWPEGGKDVGDHPPITPSRIATEYELSGDSWRLYDFISRHFIGTISPNCKYNRTTVTAALGEESFKVSGRIITNPGFTSVMHWRTTTEEDLMPDNVVINEGDQLEVTDIGLKEGETSPPDYLAESDLIEQMEKLGIGTDASMATHIANIVQRNYVRVSEKGRLMIPTDLGIVLIHGYQKIDPELALPTLRSAMEKKVSLIAEGKEKDEQILKEETEVYRKKFETFIKRIERMDELFEATFSPLASSGKVFSKCGKCRRYMHFIALRPQRLHCRTCNETYTLPQGGTIKLYKELKCPLDNFELVLFSTGSKGKGSPVCPQCYSNPPYPGFESGMNCANCPNQSCEHSLVRNWVSNCPEEKCSGKLVLDATSAPRWKLCCNKCDLVTSFNDSVHQVDLPSEVVEGVRQFKSCDDCKSQGNDTRLFNVTFGKKAEKDPIEEGCLICDSDVDELLETKVVRGGRFAGRRRGGGRGRRGRRGRGRGRGLSRGRGGRGRGSK